MSAYDKRRLQITKGPRRAQSPQPRCCRPLETTLPRRPQSPDPPAPPRTRRAASSAAIKTASGSSTPWNVETDELTQLTDDPAGVPHGSISADGEHVYYLRDRGGDEIGHYVRLPFSGGAPEDITPDLPDYASHSFSESDFRQCPRFHRRVRQWLSLHHSRSAPCQARLHPNQTGSFFRTLPFAGC